MEKLYRRYTNRTGERHLNNEGYWMTIIEYIKAINCTIQFDDGTTLYNKYYNDIIRGLIRNPNHVTMYDRGYIGVGKYKSIENGKNSKSYTAWANMFQRCYDENYHIKKPTYIGCSVVEEWYNFQVFAKWFEENFNHEVTDRLVLDKDILVRGNKIYSPETCCFVPYEINNKFTSRCAVKDFKEVADKYKNQIAYRTYKALIDRDICLK